jgi:hypothetical protein
MISLLENNVLTLASCWKIERRDGEVFYFTDHDVDITFGGDTYLASSGFMRSAIETSGAFNVDNLDIEGLLGAVSSETITEDDLRAGKFDFAEVWIFLVDYTDPDGTGSLKLRRGYLGEMEQRDDGTFKVEFRGLMQALARRMGQAYSPTCRADLYDARCGVDPDTFRESGIYVDSVTDRRTFFVTEHALEIWTPDPETGERSQSQLDSSGVLTLLRDGPQDGTPLRPYQVSTPAQLQAVQNNLNAHYVMTQNIDMTAFGLFAPITGFGGVFDGMGYQVQNVDLDHSGSPQNAGIFDAPAKWFIIKRVGVVNPTCRSGSAATWAGPLVASALTGTSGTIEDCYSEGGTVTTDGNFAGGLVGTVSTPLSYSRCYAANVISGVVGAKVGGLSGEISAGTEADTFFDSTVATTSQDGGSATAKTTAQMQTQGTFTNWDFANDWKMPGADYPRHLDPGRV